MGVVGVDVEQCAGVPTSPGRSVSCKDVLRSPPRRRSVLWDVLPRQRGTASLSTVGPWESLNYEENEGACVAILNYDRDGMRAGSERGKRVAGGEGYWGQWWQEYRGGRHDVRVGSENLREVVAREWGGVECRDQRAYV